LKTRTTKRLEEKLFKIESEKEEKGEKQNDLKNVRQTERRCTRKSIPNKINLIVYWYL